MLFGMHISHLDFFYELPIQDLGFYPKSMESNWRALCRGVRHEWMQIKLEGGENDSKKIS